MTTFARYAELTWEGELTTGRGDVTAETRAFAIPVHECTVRSCRRRSPHSSILRSSQIRSRRPLSRSSALSDSSITRFGSAFCEFAASAASASQQADVPGSPCLIA